MSCDFVKRDDVNLTDDEHTELYASTKESRKAFLDKSAEAFRANDPELHKQALELEQVYFREFYAKLDEILARPKVEKIVEKKLTYTGLARHA